MRVLPLCLVAPSDIETIRRWIDAGAKEKTSAKADAGGSGKAR